MTRTEILERRITDVPEKNKSDFRIEYGENAPDKALFDDIVSYLGEYRFNLPKFSYTLKFLDGKLRDSYRGDSMQDITQRAIGKKILEGSFYSRELAEKQGLMRLDSQLISAKGNDTVIWASPPGPKEEGYGDYGFIFVGHVNENNESEKTIQMTAIRVEDPKIEQFNQIFYLITGEKTDYKTAEEFIAHPKVLNHHLEEVYADALLGRVFSFKPNPQEQEKFKCIIQRMFSLISDFVQSAKNPRKPKAEKIREFYSLENYALRLKEEYEQPLVPRENIIADFRSSPRLPDVVGEYGYEPPKIAGSCPANSKNKISLTSSNILSKELILNSILGDEIDYEFDQDGPCEKCNADVACGPCGICKACDLAIRRDKEFSLN